MKKHARLLAMAEALVLALILGSTLVISRLALNFLGPFTLTAFRYIFASLALLPFMPHQNPFRRWTPRTWLLLLLIGVSFYALGNGALIALGGLLLLPFALLIEGVPSFGAQVWGLIVFLAVMNTALAYILYNHSLKVLAAFEVSVILSINPLITALWGWVLLSEHLQNIQILGMVVVIMGVALTQLSGHHEAK